MLWLRFINSYIVVTKQKIYIPANHPVLNKMDATKNQKDYEDSDKLMTLAEEAASVVPQSAGVSKHAYFAAYLFEQGVSLEETARAFKIMGRDAISAYEGITQANVWGRFGLNFERYPHLPVVESLYKAGYPPKDIVLAVYDPTERDIKKFGLQILTHLALKQEEIDSILDSYNSP